MAGGSDFLVSARLITGTGVATATATASGDSNFRVYCLGAAVEVTAGTATVCRLELRNGAGTVWAQTFPVPAAATSTGGSWIFPCLIPFTSVNTALNIVATTTGATATAVYGIIGYGP